MVPVSGATTVAAGVYVLHHQARVQRARRRESDSSPPA